MNEIVKVTESTDMMFSEALRVRGISQYINVSVFHDPKLKIKEHQWASLKIIDDKIKGVMLDISDEKNVPDVVVFLREDFLTNLYNISPDMANLAVAKVIEGISVNLESGRVSVNKPDVVEHLGILEKYGLDTAITTFNAAASQALEKMKQDAMENEED